MSADPHISELDLLSAATIVATLSASLTRKVRIQLD